MDAGRAMASVPARRRYACCHIDQFAAGSARSPIGRSSVRTPKLSVTTSEFDARHRPDRQRQRHDEPVVAVAARVLDHHQLRQVGGPDRHQPIGEQRVLHLPEARRRAAAEGDRRGHRRLGQRRERVIGVGAHVDLGVQVEGAPVESAVVELADRQRDLVGGLCGHAR